MNPNFPLQHSQNTFHQDFSDENPDFENEGNLSPSFERTLRKSQSAKMIDPPPSSSLETPFSRPVMKDPTPLTLIPKNLQNLFKDFSKDPPQSTRNAQSQSNVFVSGKPSAKQIEEKQSSFGNISKDIAKTILTQMNTKGIIDVTVRDLDEGKLLEETKPWKITCDMCLHKERTYLPKFDAKTPLCDFHKKVQKTIAPLPSKNANKSTVKPKKNVISGKIPCKTIKRTALKFEKLLDFSYYSGSSRKDLMEMNRIQMQNNELLKNLSDFYVSKKKLEDFLKQLQKFLQMNSSFLGTEKSQFKEFQEFFQNNKMGLEHWLKNLSGTVPEQMKILAAESEKLKKRWSERNFPIQELKLENERLLKLLETCLANNLYLEKPSELNFENLVKENITNLEKMLEKERKRASEAENFVNDYLDSNEEMNEGLKNTLKTLIEYKKKANLLTEREEEMKRLRDDNQKKIQFYLMSLENLDQWFKKHNDIFKNSGKLSLGTDTKAAIPILEKDLNEWRELFEDLNKNKHENMILRKEIDELEAKIEEALQQKMEAQFSIDKLNDVITQKEECISNHLKELYSANKTIEELQNQLLGQTNERLNTSADYSINLDDKLSKAIEQLSLMILSKDKSNSLGEDSKKFIKDVFGENFSKNFNLFEKKIKELYNQNEKLSRALQEEQIKAERFVKDIEYLITLLLEVLEVFVSEPVASRKMIDLKQKLLYNQEKINAIKTNALYPGGIRAEAVGNDMVFTNLRESFAPFTQPLYGDTSLKERMTINKPTIELQKYNNLLKEHELLESKYDNLLLENSILKHGKEQKIFQRRSDESIEWEQKSTRSKTPTSSHDLNTSLNNLKKDTKNLKDECTRLRLENEDLKRRRKFANGTCDDFMMIAFLQAKTIEDL